MSTHTTSPHWDENFGLAYENIKDPEALAYALKLETIAEGALQSMQLLSLMFSDEVPRGERYLRMLKALLDLSPDAIAGLAAHAVLAMSDGPLDA